MLTVKTKLYKNYEPMIHIGGTKTKDEFVTHKFSPYQNCCGIIFEKYVETCRNKERVIKNKHNDYLMLPKVSSTKVSDVAADFSILDII